MVFLPPIVARLARAALFAAVPACGLTALVASPRIVQAQEAKHRVVFYTEGGRGAEVTKLFDDVLPDTLEVVSTDEFKKALGKEGQKTPFGITITLESKRQQMLGRIGRAAAAMNVEVVLLGVVQKKRTGGQEVVILAVERDKDVASIDAKVTLGGKDTKDEVTAALKDLAEAWAPAEGTPTDGGGGGAEPKDGDPKKPTEDKPADGEYVRPQNVYGHEIFQINASLDIGGRFFNYYDGITPNLRDYDVMGPPGVAARVEVFPAATTGVPFVKDLGITGEFRMNFLSSETPDGQEVSTRWMRFGGGLRYRLPLGPEEKPFVLGLRGSFIQDGFRLEGDEALATELPSVTYNFVRVGLDGRFPIGPVAITAFGGYLGAISSGDVYDRFRDSAIGGIDVGGGLTVPIALGFEARLQVEYIRWFYAFHPVVGDEFVAGGALDEYLHIEIGPQYVF